MKMSLHRFDFLIIAVAVLFVISGCTVKMYTVQKQRQDRVIEGNKGYLTGEAPEKGEVDEMRTTYVFELEFGKGSKEVRQEVSMETAVEADLEPVVFEELEEEIVKEAIVIEVKKLK